MRYNFEPVRFLHIPAIDTSNIAECLCKCPKYYYNESDSKHRPQLRISAVEPKIANAIAPGSYTLERIVTPENNPTAFNFVQEFNNYATIILPGGTGTGELNMDIPTHTLTTQPVDPFNVQDLQGFPALSVIPSGVNAIILGQIESVGGVPFPAGILANSYVSNQQVLYNNGYLANCQVSLAGDGTTIAYIIINPNNPGVDTFPADFTEITGINLEYEWFFDPGHVEYNIAFSTPPPNGASYEANVNYATSAVTETTDQIAIAGDGIENVFPLLDLPDADDPIVQSWTPEVNIVSVLDIAPGAITGMAYVFNKPSVIIGLADPSDMIATANETLRVFYPSVFSVQTNAGNQQMLEQINVAFMKANANDTGIYLSGQTIFVDFQNENWRAYFENAFKMVQELNGDPLQNGQSSFDLLALPSIIRNCWDNAAAPNDVTAQVIKLIHSNVNEMGDLNKFFPPGFYVIPPANQDYYEALLADYLTASGDLYPTFLILELIP